MQCSPPTACKSSRRRGSGGLVGSLTPPAQEGEVFLVHGRSEPGAPLTLKAFGRVKERHPLPVGRELRGQFCQRALVFHGLSWSYAVQNAALMSFATHRFD